MCTIVLYNRTKQVKAKDAEFVRKVRDEELCSTYIYTTHHHI